MARPVKRPRRTIFFALAGSLLLHLLPFASSLLKATKSPPPPAQTVIAARLQPAPLNPPPLKLDDAIDMSATPIKERRKKKSRPEKTESRPSEAHGSQPANWTQAVRQHLEKLQKRGQFYPREAIARGMEGEVLVLLTIDPGGLVVAARVEQSSGYPLLDIAAIDAVRSLHSLPNDAPRQAVLPVRFRLR